MKLRDKSKRGIARREFLQHVAIGAPVGALWFVNACSTNKILEADRVPSNDERETYGIRHEASSADALRHLLTYAKAVGEMMKQPETISGKPNGLCWKVQANVHKSHCPHGTWAFFPWHREYLYRFERIIAKMGGDPAFKLPYWDWTKKPGLPASFKESSSSLNTMTAFPSDQSRKVDFSAQVREIAGPAILDGIMNTTDFESFMGGEDSSGEAEYGPHNGVHVVLGGLGSPMGDFLSPLDPIFWLHHCNVDRLWAVWQEQNKLWKDPKAIAKQYPSWLKLKLDGFYDDSGVAVKTPRTAAEVLDTVVRGYGYSGLVAKAPKKVRKKKGAVNSATAAIAAGRLPASDGDFKYELRAFTRDEIKAEFDWNANKDRVDVVFPGFRQGGNVDRLLDEATASPDDFEGWVFRLRVLNFPKVARNAVMKVSFKMPAAKGKAATLIPATQYSFFMPGADQMKGHEHHAGAYIANFNFDYKKLLEMLYDAGIETYPDPTEFRLEFVDGYSRKPVSVGKYDFANLKFKVSVLEKVPG